MLFYSVKLPVKKLEANLLQRKLACSIFRVSIATDTFTPGLPPVVEVLSVAKRGAFLFCSIKKKRMMTIYYIALYTTHIALYTTPTILSYVQHILLYVEQLYFFFKKHLLENRVSNMSEEIWLQKFLLPKFLPGKSKSSSAHNPQGEQ